MLEVNEKIFQTYDRTKNRHICNNKKEQEEKTCLKTIERLRPLDKELAKWMTKKKKKFGMGNGNGKK